MIRWAARFLLVFGLAILLAGSLGNASPVLDLANLVVMPVAIACLILLALLLWLAESWKHRAVLLVLGGLCALPLLPRDNGLAACGSEATRVKVAWLNAWGTNEPEPIIAWLEAEQPDLVGFGELNTGSRKVRAEVQALYPHVQSCKRNERCATILYAREKPFKSEPLSQGDTGNRQVLPIARMQMRQDGEQPLNLMAVHFSRPLPLGRQRREVLDLQLAIAKPADTVIIGDFNMTPRMRTLSSFARRNGFTLALADRPTWPLQYDDEQTTPLVQIDHVLAGRNWKVESLRTSDDLGSDHRGLVAQLCRET